MQHTVLKHNPENAITKLAILLGLPMDSEGHCHGTSKVGVQAFLSGEFEKFRQRILYIASQEDLEAFAEKIKSASVKQENNNTNQSEEDSMLIDVFAFLQSITIAEFPMNFLELLHSNYVNQVSDETSKFVSSKKLDDKGGFHQVDKWPGIYTKEELKNYVSVIMLAAEKHEQDFALLLSSEDHTIGLCYDHNNHCWHIIETSQLPSVSYDYRNTKELTAELLTQRLIDFFQIEEDEEEDEEEENESEDEYDEEQQDETYKQTKDEEDEEDEEEEEAVTCFETIVCISGNNKETAKVMLADLKSSQAYKECHQIKDRTHMMTDSNVTLAYTAAENNHADVVADLIKLNGLVDQPLANGVTPLWMATFEGYTDVVRELVNHVDVNHIYHGLSILGVAVLRENIEAVRLLIDAKADVNVGSVENNISPLWCAISKKRLDIAKILLENGADPTIPAYLDLTDLESFCREYKVINMSLIIEIRARELDKGSSVDAIPLTAVDLAAILGISLFSVAPTSTNPSFVNKPASIKKRANEDSDEDSNDESDKRRKVSTSSPNHSPTLFKHNTSQESSTTTKFKQDKNLEI